MNVLIVEDDPNLRMLWRAVFGDRGYSVTEAATVPEAEESLQRATYDLMLLDLYLGREFGLALVEVAARSSPTTRIVIVTGAAQARLPYGGGNIHSVLRKPVDVEDLLDIANRATATAPVAGFGESGVPPRT